MSWHVIIIIGILITSTDLKRERIERLANIHVVHKTSLHHASKRTTRWWNSFTTIPVCWIPSHTARRFKSIIFNNSSSRSWCLPHPLPYIPIPTAPPAALLLRMIWYFPQHAMMISSPWLWVLPHSFISNQLLQLPCATIGPWCLPESHVRIWLPPATIISPWTFPAWHLIMLIPKWLWSMVVLIQTFSLIPATHLLSFRILLPFLILLSSRWTIPTTLMVATSHSLIKPMIPPTPLTWPLPVILNMATICKHDLLYFFKL